MFFESWYLNLSVLGFLIFALIFDYVTKFFSYWYVRHVPYKTSIPFFGSDYFRVLGIRSNTEDVNANCTKYPLDNFVGRVKSRIPDLIVKDPNSIKSMLSTDFLSFHRRGLYLDKSQDVCIRDNLFYAEGEKWALLREGYVSLLKDISCEFDNLSDYLPVTNSDACLQDILSKVLDKIFKDLLLGDVGGSVIENLRTVTQKRTLLEKFKTYLKNIFPSLYILFGLTTIPGEPSSKTKQIIEKSVLLSKIRSLDNVYLLSLQENNKKRSDVDFAYSLLATFITEGYVPCLNILIAFLYEMALNPEAQEKYTNFVAKGEQEAYLDAAIKETLRLHPPYSIISRECTKTYHPEAGLLIDKSITISIPIAALHRDSDHYNNPKAFKPERFLEVSSSNNAFTYLPFGAGPRKCVGELLALNIIKKVSEAVLSTYSIECCKKTLSELTMVDHNFGRVVENDIWLRFNKRI